MTLALAGAIAGVAGFAIALAAHNRAGQVVQECANILRRQLQVANGTADGQALRDLAIVHYDALKEMSGRLSFSMALINGEGDGVVLTSINGRSETRTYAKIIRAGYGLNLSPEEEQALRAARLGKGPSVSMDDPLPDFGHRGSEPGSAGSGQAGAGRGGPGYGDFGHSDPTKAPA